MGSTFASRYLSLEFGSGRLPADWPGVSCHCRGTTTDKLITPLSRRVAGEKRIGESQPVFHQSPVLIIERSD